MQVFSMFKLLSYPQPFATPQGDGFERAWLQRPGRGRVVIDVGLHNCEALAEGVANGYVVHGFEPVPEHMANCHARLFPGTFFQVPIEWNASGVRALVERRPKPEFITVNGTRLGFAFLYQAALGNESALLNFTVNGGHSSVSGSGIIPLHRLRYSQNIIVPMLRLDDVIEDDLWLLKLDTQGFESFVLSGARSLFSRFVVAHVFTEFDLKGTHAALKSHHITDEMLALKLLHRYGFVCFDVRNGDDPHAAPWALGRDHPNSVKAYYDALYKHDHLATKQRPMPHWRKYGGGTADDWACINVMKVYDH